MKPWEKYQQPVQQGAQPSGDGPWAKYKSEATSQAPVEEKTPGIYSAIRGFADGASAGFSDELSGVLEAGGRVVGLKGVGGTNILDTEIAEDGPELSWDKLKEAYKSARDQGREDIKQDRKDNPGITAGANLAGMVGSPLNKVASGMSLAKAGATMGGVYGLGESEGEGVQEVLIDTATGAVIGGTVGKVIDKAAPIIKAGAKGLSKSAKGTAEKLAARSIGAERGTIKKLGQDKVQQAGRFALDNKIVTPLSTTEQKIARTEAMKRAAGGSMDEVYQSIDDVGGSTFNPLEAAAQVDDKIGGFYRSPINRGETNQLENTLESIIMRGEKNIPLKEAQILKQELGGVANWRNTLSPTDKEKMARDAYGVISKNIDEAVEAGAKKVGSKDLLNKLGKAKKDYGSAKVAEQLLENKNAREQGNKLFGLTDSIAGVGSFGYGTATGDWEKAAGFMLAKKGLERYGAQTGAKILDSLSKNISITPKMGKLIQKNPAVLQTIISRFENNLYKGPRAADKKKGGDTDKKYVAKLKGKSKWELDGFSKIVEKDKNGVLSKKKVIDKLFSTKKGRKLLVSASTVRSDKSLLKILDQIKLLEGAE